MPKKYLLVRGGGRPGGSHEARVYCTRGMLLLPLATGVIIDGTPNINAPERESAQK